MFDLVLPAKSGTLRALKQVRGIPPKSKDIAVGEVAINAPIFTTKWVRQFGCCFCQFNTIFNRNLML